MLPRIVALAPGSGLCRLRARIGADRLVELDGVAQLAPALRDPAVRQVIIDPMAFSERAFNNALNAVVAAGMRLIIYALLEKFDYTRLLSSHKCVLPEVVFRETDDDWIRVLDVLRGDGESVPARVLATVAPRAQTLGNRLCGQTVALFAHVPIPDGVAEFAAAAGETPAALRGAYQVAGFAPPHDLLDIARLGRAFGDLGNPDVSIERVAERHGFGTRRTLERRADKLVGVSPRAAAHTFNSAEFALRLAAACRRC